MKNITLSADEGLIEQARRVARSRRTTLNEPFREWLAQYAAQQLLPRRECFRIAVRRESTREDESSYHEALRVAGRHHLNWYDALIVAGALAGGCEVLYSEDLHSGQVIEGLRIENPFV